MPFDFDQFQAVLLDLDGTIYYEDHPLPGAVDLIRRFQREGRRFACLTNSTSSPERIAQRLKTMGVILDPIHIYTAARAACDFVLKRFAPQSNSSGNGKPLRPRVFNLATEGVQDMLDGKVDWISKETDPCDAVVCGVPENVYATPERQRTAMVLLKRGATLLSICADRIYPSPRGLEFGVGAMSAMLAYAADVKPVFCGKPEQFFFREICERLGVSPDRCVLFGDNLESDIAGAKSVGMQTALVLTGITTRNDVPTIPETLRPDVVISSLMDV